MSNRLRRIRTEKILLQNGRCYWCDRPMLPLDSPSVWRASADHVIPLRAGGTTEWRNIVAAHWWCNHRRTQPPSPPPKETAMPEERPGATIADEIARLVHRNPLPSEEETRLRREAALLNAQAVALEVPAVVSRFPSGGAFGGLCRFGGQRTRTTGGAGVAPDSAAGQAT
jgi:hypothetical protein